MGYPGDLEATPQIARIIGAGDSDVNVECERMCRDNPYDDTIFVP
jgi:hypothetical protein